MNNQRGKLICFADQNNLHIIIAVAHLKDLYELIIQSDLLADDEKINLKAYLEDHFRLSHLTFSELGQVMESMLTWDNTALVVNACTGVNQFALLVQAAKGGATIYYADTVNGVLKSLAGRYPAEVEGGPVELTVHDLMELAGCSVEESNSEELESDETTSILNFILQDRIRWDKIRKQIKNNITVSEDWVTLGAYYPINLSSSPHLATLLDYLKKHGLAKEIITETKHVSLQIPNPTARRFLEVMGLWLEALVFRTIRRLPYIDDAMVSVKFLWDECPEYVGNELDVLAAMDSRMIVVSCKDTIEVSTAVLNELEVYADKIAGSGAIKLLITAKPVASIHMTERAKAMGIHIVYFNGNLNLFSSILDSILRREMEEGKKEA